jgi:hypothetical protein
MYCLEEPQELKMQTGVPLRFQILQAEVGSCVCRFNKFWDKTDSTSLCPALRALEMRAVVPNLAAGYTHLGNA